MKDDGETGRFFLFPSLSPFPLLSLSLARLLSPYTLSLASPLTSTLYPFLPLMPFP